jgi:small-conductance mechanosensitive channel
VGDSIRVGTDLSGTVEDITMRHTVIRDAENARIIIPNSIINSQTVINYDIIDSRFKKKITFNISLDNDLDLAVSILKKTLFAQPEVLHERYSSAEDIEVDLTAITDKFVTLRALVWTKNADEAGRLGNHVNKIIFDEYRSRKITFSEPQTLLIQQAAR